MVKNVVALSTKTIEGQFEFIKDGARQIRNNYDARGIELRQVSQTFRGDVNWQNNEVLSFAVILPFVNLSSFRQIHDYSPTYKNESYRLC